MTGTSAIEGNLAALTKLRKKSINEYLSQIYIKKYLVPSLVNSRYSSLPIIAVFKYQTPEIKMCLE